MPTKHNIIKYDTSAFIHTTAIETSKIPKDDKRDPRREMAEVGAPPAGRDNILAKAQVAAATDNHQHCLVCYSDLTSRGKTPCQHDDICGVCHLRLRFLHEDKKCPICKTENERLIVDSDPVKKFEDYPMWGDEIGADYFHRQDVGMFFQSFYYEQDILPLFGHGCNKCEYTAEQEAHAKHSSLRKLQDHLRTKHRLTLCSLCVDHKRDFVANLPRFTPSQLQKHLRQGDGPTSGFSGHPVCEFCKPKRFYDLAFLHQHLHKEHYKCHVCEKQGLDNQFFKNYKSLERHFDQQHFLCHDVQCLAARFVVFDSELDLRGHELSVHGGSSTGSTKINLEFRTRRVGYDGSGVENQQQAAPSESDFNYGLDGQAFVPQALPNSGGGGTRPRNAQDVQLHPLHLQRTEELRAQAAAIREQQSLQSQDESFPTLQALSATGSSAAPLVGWSTGLSTIHRPKKKAGQVTEEDFPSLGPAPSSNSNGQRKGLRENIGATRRQFAAMSTTSAAPSSAHAGNFLVPPAATTSSSNRQENLAPSQFPSLGAPSNVRPTYSAAHNNNNNNNNYARKMQGNYTTRGPAPPSVNSTADFPTIGAANQAQGKGNSVRDRVLGSSAPSQQAMSNVLQAAPSISAQATIEEMKASLGPKRFKQLKGLTKNFAEGNLSPEGYVDQSAALFDRGYADLDFWSFLPSLLDSCPNTQAAEGAMMYMVSLKRQQFEEKKPTATLGRPVAGGQSWGNGPSIAAVTPVVVGPFRAAYPTAPARPMAMPSLVASKKKQAWGGSGAATVVRAKAPPGSVAIAAASQGPKNGSATKFMAKQAKQETKASTAANTGGKKKKKNKQNDELRALAFGGK